MKLTKTTYNLLLRLIAGIAASLILLGATALISQKSSKSLFQSASGVKPESLIMTVDGRDIYAEEYLYWLDYYCDYYNQYLNYMGVTGWDTELEPGFTAGDYISQQAELQTVRMILQYAVINNWAEEAGITLTEEDLQDIAVQREMSVEQLGGEDAYQQWLKNLGVSESFINRSLEHSYLINHLSELYCTEDSPLYPGHEAIDAYANSHEYLAASILFIDTCEMDSSEQEAALAKMEGYSATLRESKKIDEDFSKIAAELGAEDVVTTFRSDTVDAKIATAVRQLYMNTASSVIKTDEGYYIVVRRYPETNGVIADMLNEEFTQRCADAEIVYNDEVYGSINTLSFYRKILASQGISVG